MLDFKPHVGKTSGPFLEVFDENRVKRFASAISATNLSGIPPTLFTVCRRGEFELLQQMGVPLSSVLHGEQIYIYDSPVSIGSELETKTCLASTHEKKGKDFPLHFLLFETEIKDKASGHRVALAKTNVIVQERQSP